MKQKWFDECFKRTIGHEGKFQKHPGDRGNWTTGVVGKGQLKGTKWGISAMTYPDRDIEGMTLEEAKAIYYFDWWLKLGMGRWPEPLAYQLFDAAINHGDWNASRMLQRALKVEDDGKIGPKTLTAVGTAHMDDLLKRLLAERLEFITYLGVFGTFGKGWCRRIADNLRYAAGDTPNDSDNH